MAAMSKKMCILINYKNIKWTIKMTPIDVKLSTYIDSDVENNDKDPKLVIM